MLSDCRKRASVLTAFRLFTLQNKSERLHLYFILSFFISQSYAFLISLCVFPLFSSHLAFIHSFLDQLFLLCPCFLLPSPYLPPFFVFLPFVFPLFLCLALLYLGYLSQFPTIGQPEAAFLITSTVISSIMKQHCVCGRSQLLQRG